MGQWFEQLVDFGGSARNLRWIAVLLLVLLLVLAGLQYYWIGQLSDAKRTEMQQALRATSGRFAAEFNREISRVYGALLMGRPFSEGDGAERYAERYQQWAGASAHSRMVKGLYLLKGSEAQKLQTESLVFAKVTLPAEWTPLTEQLQRITERGARGAGGPGPRGLTGNTAEVLPVLIAPRFERNEEGEPRIAGWALVELDVEYLQSEILPEMSHRHFGENYQIRILRKSGPDTPIFQTANSTDFSRPDFEGPLFDINPQEVNRATGRRFGGGGFGGGGGRDKEPPRRPRAEGPPPFQGGGPGQGPGGPGGPGQGPQGRWLLQAKHRSGSLDSAVQTLRLKNIGISSAVMLLMGVAIGAFVASTRRAQTLALQQMEFVASVSHELRTPLTVICSAGDNLAGGVVKNDAQVKRYGNLIRSEGRRLADMVEQILGYAGIQKGRLPDPKPVEVAGVVDSALRACADVLESKGCTVERHVPGDLPLISGDAEALSHCVQNLLTNAAKYGGDWVAVHAEEGAGGRIRITVEDHGPGIEPKELRHIFEPFYRGKQAIDEQVHGTGLGLSLVKRIVEAHSGRVSVESKLGEGTRFTLELPAMARETEPVAV